MTGPRPGRILTWAAALGALVTAAVALLPGARFAYDNPSLHVALETAEGLIAALLAYLAVGRVRGTQAVQDLALAVGFASFAVANLFVSAVPAVALQERPGGFVTWMALLIRLTGAAAFLWAATASARTVVLDRRTARNLLGAGVVVLAVIMLLSQAADLWLSASVARDITPAASNRPRLDGHPLLLTAQALGAVCLAVAAVRLDRRASDHDDELLRWLAGGAALGAASRVTYCLFPSLYSEWVYVGDLLRLSAYLLFLAGAGREITSYWRDRADAAVAGERARIARELHDGLVQELSFIRSQTAAMTSGMSIPGMGVHLHGAAERALEESRRAVEVLADHDGRSLARRLAAAAEEVATRAGATVRTEGAPGLVASAVVQDALVRITREATSNAVRHGAARTVTLRLQPAEEGLHLVIADDGTGFDPTTVRRGFGLKSMRERVEGLGGQLDVRAETGRGTTVEVRVWNRSPARRHQERSGT